MTCNNQYFLFTFISHGDSNSKFGKKKNFNSKLKYRKTNLMG